MMDKPAPPDSDAEDTRTIVTRLAKEHQTAVGRSAVWQWIGGVGVALGLTVAGGGFAYARQVDVDHERTDRLERDVASMRQDLDAIRRSLGRIEGRLGTEEE